MLGLALFLPLVIGWVVVHLLLPEPSARPRWAVSLMKVSLGTGLGAGLASCICFLLLLAGLPSRVALISVELLLLAAVVVPALPSKSRAAAKPPPDSAPRFTWNRFLGLAVILGVVLLVASFVEAARSNSHGDWDAWSIWNLRAKFLTAPSEAWKNAYSPLLERTHPNYPLLVSSFVARAWKYSGEVTAAAPVATALIFQLSAAGLLISAAAILRSASAGLLAGLVLLASSGWLGQGARQYADVPLSLFILGAMATLLWADVFERDRKPALLLAGACGGFAAWTKNEGLLFLLILMAVLLLVEWRAGDIGEAGRKWVLVAIGSLPAIILTLYFKFFLAPPSRPPLLSPSLPENLARLGQVDRYVKILSAFAAEALRLGSGWTHPFVLLAILAAALRLEPDPSQKRWTALAGSGLACLLGIFFLTYILTQQDVDWLLSTSLDRLYAQVWPSLVLLAFVLLRRPEDAAVRPAGKEKSKRG